MLYVVEAGQQLHFQRLKGILRVLGHCDLADRIEHVRFGKIRGLSTRKGRSYFCATNHTKEALGIYFVSNSYRYWFHVFAIFSEDEIFSITPTDEFTQKCANDNHMVYGWILK